MTRRKKKHGTVTQLREVYRTQHCRVLNYLLDVAKGGDAGRRRREEAFDLATWTAFFAHNDLNPRIHPDIRLHRLGRAYHKSLEKVDEAIAKAQRDLNSALEWIERELQSSEGGEDFGASYSHYTGHAVQHRRMRKQIADWRKPKETDFKIPLDTLKTLASHVRTLVLVQDRPRMQFEKTLILSEDGEEAKRLRTLQRAGWETLPERYAHSGLAALNAVRDYLHENDDFLCIGSQPPNLFLLEPNGLREDPFFKAFFRPILDVLVDNSHPVQLGVCEVCEGVYVRNRMGREHDTQSRVCDGNCRRARVRK